MISSEVEYVVYVWTPSTFLDAGRVYVWDGYASQEAAEIDASDGAQNNPTYIFTITKRVRTEESV